MCLLLDPLREGLAIITCQAHAAVVDATCRHVCRAQIDETHGLMAFVPVTSSFLLLYSSDALCYYCRVKCTLCIWFVVVCRMPKLPQNTVDHVHRRGVFTLDFILLINTCPKEFKALSQTQMAQARLTLVMTGQNRTR